LRGTCKELARNIPGIFKGYSRDLPGSSPKTIQGRCDSSRYVPEIYKFFLEPRLSPGRQDQAQERSQYQD